MLDQTGKTADKYARRAAEAVQDSEDRMSVWTLDDPPASTWDECISRGMILGTDKPESGLRRTRWSYHSGRLFADVGLRKEDGRIHWWEDTGDWPTYHDCPVTFADKLYLKWLAHPCLDELARNGEIAIRKQERFGEPLGESVTEDAWWLRWRKLQAEGRLLVLTNEWAYVHGTWDAFEVYNVVAMKGRQVFPGQTNVEPGSTVALVPVWRGQR